MRRVCANEQNADCKGNTIAHRWWFRKDRIGMNRDRFHGIWKQFSGTVKEQWGALTDDPLTVAAAARDRLAGKRLEQRGISKQEADRQLDDFQKRNRYWWDLSRR